MSYDNPCRYELEHFNGDEPFMKRTREGEYVSFYDYENLLKAYKDLQEKIIDIYKDM